MSNTPTLETAASKTPRFRPISMEESMQLEAIIKAHTAASTPKRTQQTAGNLRDDSERRLASFAALKGFKELDNDDDASSGISSDDGEYLVAQLTILGLPSLVLVRNRCHVPRPEPPKLVRRSRPTADVAHQASSL